MTYHDKYIWGELFLLISSLYWFKQPRGEIIFWYTHFWGLCEGRAFAAEGFLYGFITHVDGNFCSRLAADAAGMLHEHWKGKFYKVKQTSVKLAIPYNYVNLTLLEKKTALSLYMKAF